jgi:hypothetical protein
MKKQNAISDFHIGHRECNISPQTQNGIETISPLVWMEHRRKSQGRHHGRSLSFSECDTSGSIASDRKGADLFSEADGAEEELKLSDRHISSKMRYITACRYIDSEEGRSQRQ